MPKYRLNYGESFEFYAQSAGEVVPILRDRHVAGDGDERVFCRRLASEMCEWNGRNYCYHNRDALAVSMLRNGLLEELVD